MNKGLTRKEIEEKVKKLPFKLPEEVYELYQWANGGINSFIPHSTGWDLTSFRSLEENIENWDGSFDLFVLFVIEDVGYFILPKQEKKQTSPIYCNDVPKVIEDQPSYSSLTSMMQSIADGLTGTN